MTTARELASYLYTIGDLERLSAQGYRYELIHGELVEMSPAGSKHGSFTGRLSSRLHVLVEESELGEAFAAETGFLISQNPDTVLAPDWAFVREDRIPDPLPDGFLPVVPDLVLETRSPNDSARQVARKIRRWLDAGAQVVLDLDPIREALTVHRLGQEPETLGAGDTLRLADVLPGLSLPLRLVFRPAR